MDRNALGGEEGAQSLRSCQKAGVRGWISTEKHGLPRVTMVLFVAVGHGAGVGGSQVTLQVAEVTEEVTSTGDTPGGISLSRGFPLRWEWGKILCSRGGGRSE